MAVQTDGVQQKALKINLDARKFGTFAEIGAGQEVARWFFQRRRGRTVAKSISAYDMAISEGLYGPTEQNVSRQRLEAILDSEFKELTERLDRTWGEAAFNILNGKVIGTCQDRHRSREFIRFSNHLEAQLPVD
jgi:hypothetical protein